MLGIFLTVLISTAHAQQADTWMFETKWDKFNIKQKNGLMVIGNREANMNVFEDFSELFDFTFSDPCPYDLPKNPDAKVKKKSSVSNNSEELEFYINKNYAKNASQKKCLFIGGFGLRAFPLHRDWFIGSTHLDIKIDKDFILNYSDKLEIDLSKKKGRWNNNKANQFLNWEYFEQVAQALNKAPISQRISGEFTKSKKVEMKTNGKSFTFVEVAPDSWALQIPKVKWLYFSSSFVIFENFNGELWVDRNSKIFATLTDKTLPLPDRRSALNRLGDQWSPGIKKSLQNIVLDPDDFNLLKLDALKKLKRKPTDENMKVLVESLAVIEDFEVLESITKILRIKNPKGPIISDEDPDKKEQQVKTWESWAKSL